MATYCYSRHGQVIERDFPMGKAPKKVRILGAVYARDYGAEWSGKRNEDPWPIHSLAISCSADPVERKRLEAEHARRGVPLQVDEQGRTIIPSNDLRNKLLEAYEMGDSDAGYGQRAPKPRHEVTFNPFTGEELGE